LQADSAVLWLGHDDGVEATLEYTLIHSKHMARAYLHADVAPFAPLGIDGDVGHRILVPSVALIVTRHGERGKNGGAADPAGFAESLSNVKCHRARPV
jgi:hypothetical protein